MDLEGSSSLKDIPDLSMATNLETLRLSECKSLVELPSSIRNLNKLLELEMENCESLKILPTGFNLKSLDYLNFNYCSELRTFPEFSTNISVLSLLDTYIEKFPSNLYLENLVTLEISKAESDDKQWEGVKPSFTPFLAMLSPTLTEMWLENILSLVELPSSFQNLNQLQKLRIDNCRNLQTLPSGINFLSPTLTELYLSNIPSLVELPSSIQNLYQLEKLTIVDCRNLETLPSGINFQSLNNLYFSGCSRLRSFPEISTNISHLDLGETGIEEVPWRIEKFSNLKQLFMNGCSKLKCVSLNISKLKHLLEVNFSNCGALTGVDLSGYPSENIDTETVLHQQSPFPKVILLGCFNLDPETVFHQQSIIFKSIILPGEEVPSYFTHRTTGSSSLTIPLLHVPLSQPFFRFRVGALGTNNVNKYGVLNIKVNCEFKGRFGNTSFDVVFQFDVYPHYTEIPESRDNVLTIMDCRIPLNEDNAPLAQRNYDHVDIQIHYSGMVKIKEWGLRVLEECSLPENRLPHVCEADEDNLVNKTEHSEECVETVVKRQREIGSDSRLSEGPLKKPRLCPASDPGYFEPQKKKKEKEKKMSNRVHERSMEMEEEGSDFTGKFGRKGKIC